MMELKACPFCGGKIIQTGKEERRAGIVEHYVYCYECNSSTAGYRLMHEAIEAWNRRENTNEQTNRKN